MRIIKSELKSAGITKSIDLLKECDSNLDQLISSLDTFISDDYLKSDSYNKLKSLAKQYKELLVKDKQITGNFSQLIDSTTSNMVSYMEEFEEMDDGKKNEISDSIIALKNSIAKYNADLETFLDDKASINEMNAIIQTKANAQASLEYFNKLLDKINNLASYDSSQYSQLDIISNDFSSMEKGMLDIASLK